MKTYKKYFIAAVMIFSIMAVSQNSFAMEQDQEIELYYPTEFLLTELQLESDNNNRKRLIELKEQVLEIINDPSLLDGSLMIDIENMINHLFYTFEEATTLLAFACKINDTESVQFLLKHGTSPNISNKSGKMPLDYEVPLDYAVNNNNIDMVKLLVKHGANVNQYISPYETIKIEYSNPLHSAAIRGFLDIVIYLVNEAGADIFSKYDSTNKDTPLEFAKRIKYLCEKGMYFNLKKENFPNLLKVIDFLEEKEYERKCKLEALQRYHEECSSRRSL